MSFPSVSQFWGSVGDTLSNIRIRPEVGQALSSLGNFLNPKNHVDGLISPMKQPTLPVKQATNTPLNVSGIPSSSPIINTSNAPIINNANAVSNIRTSTDATAAHIAQVNAALQAGYSVSDTPQYDASGKIIPKDNSQMTTPPGGTTPGAAATPEPSAFDKLLGLFQKGQDQINAIPGAPSLEDATNKILAQFGYTPESFKQVADLNNQLTSVNTQINDLETQRQTEIANVAGRGGSTIGSEGAEEGRINRAYAIRESGLTGKASILTASISALTGAYDKAETAAKDYVASATIQQKQLVSDIQYSMSFYKDVYTAMDASDQKRMNDILDYQTTILKQQETAAQNDINNELKKQGLDIQAMLAQNKIAGSAAQPGAPVNPQTGAALPDLNETKNKDLNNANKLVLDAQKLIDLINASPSVVARGTIPLIGAFQTDAGQFSAAYNAILHTYASEISTQLLRTSSNQDTIKSLLPKISNSKEANIANLQGLIDKANGLMNGIDPTGGYRQNFGYNIAGSSSGGSGSDRVTVVSPTGAVGTIPSSQLQQALSQGYKQK